jgi:hypothetical protein
MSENFDPSQGVRRISRRTVAKGAAWSVPVLMMATATPAFATSPGGLVQISGAGCKLPGNSTNIYKGYAFNLVLNNSSGTANVQISILSMTLGGQDLGQLAIVNLENCTTMSQPITIVAGGILQNLAIVTANAPSSQNGTLVANYQSDDGNGSTTATASDLGPISGNNGLGGSCSSFTDPQKTCLYNGTFV